MLESWKSPARGGAHVRQDKGRNMYCLSNASYAERTNGSVSQMKHGKRSHLQTANLKKVHTDNSVTP